MLEQTPLAEVVHSLPGRTRLRIAAYREDAAVLDAVAAGLSAIPGIQRITVRPLTGSVLLWHDPPMSRIAKAAEDAGLFRLACPGDYSRQPHGVVLDPKMVVVFGFGLAALWQIFQGRILPPAITLAWYASMLATNGTVDGEE
jgi:hypothetical protein